MVIPNPKWFPLKYRKMIWHERRVYYNSNSKCCTSFPAGALGEALFWERLETQGMGFPIRLWKQNCTACAIRKTLVVHKLWIIGLLVAAWLLLFFSFGAITWHLRSVDLKHLSWVFFRTHAAPETRPRIHVFWTQLSSPMLQSFLSIFSVSATELPQDKSVTLWELKGGQGECGEYMNYDAKTNGNAGR